MNILAYVHLRNIYRSTGAGRVAREMTEHLSQQPSVNLQVLADPEDHQRVIHKVGKPWTDYQYHFIGNETSNQQARWYFLNSPAAESYWPEAEIVYCTAESYVPVRKSRLAVTCHDAQLFEPGAHKMSASLLKQRWKWKLLFSRLAKTTDLFHTISQFSAEQMSHYFPAIRSRLRVVSNAVSPRFFEPSSEQGRQVLYKLGIADKPFLLVPGGLHHRKNADLILKAWPSIREKCPDLLLVVINHCDPAYLEQAKALSPSLILAGFQEEEQLCALYSAAQLVWFPSRYEGFGLPVLEAMACGTPVVTSNSTGLPEVAGNAATLISPNQPDDHVDAMVALLDDTQARESFRQLGQARARQFTWKSSAAQLTEHFSQLL